MMIVSMDIATSTGIAVGEAGADPHSWSVDLGKGQSEDTRFSSLLTITSKLIADYEPDLLAVEAAVGGPQTSHLLVGMVACVRGVAANRGVRVVSYHSGAIRKHMLGRALTTRDYPGLSKAKAKQAIKQAVMDRCKLLGWDAPDHDAADASFLHNYASAMERVQVRPGGELFNNAR